MYLFSTPVPPAGCSRQGRQSARLSYLSRKDGLQLHVCLPKGQCAGLPSTHHEIIPSIPCTYTRFLPAFCKYPSSGSHSFPVFLFPYYIQKENIRQPCFPNISKKRTILSRQSSYPFTCYFLLLFPLFHTSCNQQNYRYACHCKHHCDLHDRRIIAGADVSARRVR